MDLGGPRLMFVLASLGAQHQGRRVHRRRPHRSAVSSETQYWIETATNHRHSSSVAVILCVAIGIPIGIACGRIDGIWSGRQTPARCDASGPLVRLHVARSSTSGASATTSGDDGDDDLRDPAAHTGSRTSASDRCPRTSSRRSRAYGAPEWRVLTDVQLPLARPSHHDGRQPDAPAGDLDARHRCDHGRRRSRTNLLFQALSNQDSGSWAPRAGALAFFLVAVVLDRISPDARTPATAATCSIASGWRGPIAAIPRVTAFPTTLQAVDACRRRCIALRPRRRRQRAQCP